MQSGMSVYSSDPHNPYIDFDLSQLHSWKTGGTHALVVDDLNDGGESACVRSCTEERNTANLNILPLRGGHLCIAHLAGCVKFSWPDYQLDGLECGVRAFYYEPTWYVEELNCRCLFNSAAVRKSNNSAKRQDFWKVARASFCLFISRNLELLPSSTLTSTLSHSSHSRGK